MLSSPTVVFSSAHELALSRSIKAWIRLRCGSAGAAGSARNQECAVRKQSEDRNHLVLAKGAWLFSERFIDE